MILKDLEKLENGTVRVENLEAQGRRKQGEWNAYGVNAGHGDREKRKRFEVAK